MVYGEDKVPYGAQPGGTFGRGHIGINLSKLHLATRTQAALYALREGYVPLYNADN